MTNESLARSLVIGFEPPARSPGGIARYTRELVTALESIAHAENQSADELRPRPDITRTQVWERLRPLAARAWAGGVRAGFGAHIGGATSPSAARDDPHRAQAFTFHATSVLAPPRGAHPLVVTVHDTVPFTHPQTLTPHGATWHQRMITRAVRDADAIVVPTQAVKRSLVTEFASVDVSSRIHVAGGAASLEPVSSVDARELLEACGVSGRPYVIFVGTIEPRKGLDVLIQAIGLRTDLDLVIVGAQGWGGVDLRALMVQARVDSSRVVVTGALHDIAVAALIQQARALVLPSQAEGFGLPVVEAMRLGTPVVVSDDAALSEVVAGAGVIASIVGCDRSNPSSIRAAAHVLNEALDVALEHRDSLIHSGVLRAHAFSWRATAQTVLGIHDQLQ